MDLVLEKFKLFIFAIIDERLNAQNSKYQS